MPDFPNRPIRFMTYSAGGGRDLVASLIAQGISVPLGQPVTIEHVEGSDSAPAEFVAKAPPDGHTLLFLGPSFWIGALLKEDVTYDPVRDFSPITITVTQPNVLVVHPAVPANSVAELIALARARPGELKYASGLVGTSSQLSCKLFTDRAGVNIVGVHYEVGSSMTFKTATSGINDLLAGKVHMMMFSAASAMPHVKAGKLKALAVTSAQPSVLAPGVPTVAATLPGFETVQPMNVYAPAKTPDAVIKRLNYEIVRFLNSPGVKERLLEAGMEVVASTPEELAAKVKSEIAIVRQLMKDAHINK